MPTNDERPDPKAEATRSRAGEDLKLVSTIAHRADQEPMSRGDREQLIRLARLRARQAKSEAKQREKVLLAQAEDLMTTEFSAQDQLWDEATDLAEQAASQANVLIAARCLAEFGIPAGHAPQLHLMWSTRGSQFSDRSRRAELRKLAQARLTALTATAGVLIDAQQLDIETALITDGLGSGEARAFLEKMPTAAELMPELTLDDLGVKHWQAAEGAASALLSPSTSADLKRQKILRAIEANPQATDRAVAAIAGCDHKTIAHHRRKAGEFPTLVAEFPTLVAEFPTQIGEIPSDGGGQ